MSVWDRLWNLLSRKVSVLIIINKIVILRLFFFDYVSLELTIELGVILSEKKTLNNFRFSSTPLGLIDYNIGEKHEIHETGKKFYKTPSNKHSMCVVRYSNRFTTFPFNDGEPN